MASLHTRINGFTHLNLTKLDVLDNLAEIQIGVAYKAPGGKEYTSSMPADLDTMEQVGMSDCSWQFSLREYVFTAVVRVHGTHYTWTAKVAGVVMSF